MPTNFIDMRNLALLPIALMLASCAAGPSPQQLAAADYGPMPADYQAMIKKYVDDRLRDPTAGAKYEFYKPLTKSWFGFSGVGQYGWATCVTVNAKNGYGGMTGPLPSYFFIRDGLITQAVHSDTDGALKVTELCSTI